MRQGFLMVGAATPDLRVGDPRFNTQKLLELIDIADQRRAKLLVFPELCVTGASGGDLLAQRPVLEAADSALYDIVEHTENLDLVVVFGAPVDVGGKLYNCAVVASHGKVFGVVPQTVVSDPRFTPAPRRNGKAIVAGMEVSFGTDLIFENLLLPELRFAVTVGNELLSPYSPAVRHCSAGANLLLNLNAAGLPAGGAAAETAAFAALSARLGCGILRADAGAGESVSGLPHMAHNLILEAGEVLKEGRMDSQVVLPCDLDVQLLERVRACRRPPQHPDAYETVYFDLKPAVTELLRTVSPFPFVLPETEDREVWTEDIMETQARFLARRLDESGCGALVVMVDGDVCSTLAVLAAIRAAKKMGWNNDSVIAVICPHRGMTRPTINRAVSLADNLSVVKCFLEIDATVESRLAMLGADEEKDAELTATIRRRTQMSVAADVAEQVGGLLVLTEDMTDWAQGKLDSPMGVGYCSVNAGLPKTVLRYVLINEMTKVADQRQLSMVLKAILSQGAGGNNRSNVEDTEHAVFTPLQMNDFFLYHVLAHGFGPSKLQRLGEAAFGNQHDDRHIYDCLKNFLEKFIDARVCREAIPAGPALISLGLRPEQFRLPSDADLRLWRTELEGVMPEGYDPEEMARQDAEREAKLREAHRKMGSTAPEDFENKEDFAAEMLRVQAQAQAQIERERAIEAAQGDGLPKSKEPLPFLGDAGAAPMPKFEKPSSPEEYAQQMKELQKLAQAQIERERAEEAARNQQ